MSFLKKHRLLLVIAYIPVYLLWFFLLERITPGSMFVVENPLDAWIPFCEYFIIPYLLWFPYLAWGLISFYRREKEAVFYRLAYTLIAGLTICLIIYTFFPNMQMLRPEQYPNDNVFTAFVRLLQGFDTPTNVCPSIHVFVTTAIQLEIMRSGRLRERPVVVWGTFILAVLICLSTVFLKQHSVTDVLCAWGLNAVLYALGAHVGRRGCES